MYRTSRIQSFGPIKLAVPLLWVMLALIISALVS